MQHVRGTIVEVTSTTLTISTANGSEEVALTPKSAVAGVVPATRADIKPNTFIGSANIQQGANARALEVVVFPDSMRGTGEGDYPWDLPATEGAKSSMTNGTVSRASSMTNGTVSRASSMTNGTVSAASGNGQLGVTVVYKGGSKTLTIPRNVPIVRIAPSSRAALVRGAHVFAVVTTVDGHPTAAFVVVGERGTVPPM